MHEKTVCGIVVTYNRKELLLECLAALLQQSVPVSGIYVIDNASGDDTPQALYSHQFIPDIPPDGVHETWESEGRKSSGNAAVAIHYVRMPENISSAGGFHEGMKRAYRKGYEWLWMMDDDSIAQADALEILLEKISRVDLQVGFACSKVLWNDGTPHLMNIPQLQEIINGKPFNACEASGILLVRAASFVSLLIHRAVLEKVGLPLSAFFIWRDDLEYTERITDRGYLGLYVKDSIVYHKTATNYSADVFSDRRENAWKHYYGIRNDLYIKRKKRGMVQFLLFLIYNLISQNISILKRRKENRLKFMWINTRATVAAFFFHPEIEFPRKDP